MDDINACNKLNLGYCIFAKCDVFGGIHLYKTGSGHKLLRPAGYSIDSMSQARGYMPQFSLPSVLLCLLTSEQCVSEVRYDRQYAMRKRFGFVGLLCRLQRRLMANGNTLLLVQCCVCVHCTSSPAHSNAPSSYRIWTRMKKKEIDRTITKIGERFN